jgi:hypothetical protein
LILGVMACLISGICFLSLHLPIGFFLPEYRLSITPGKVLILACYFGVVSYMPTIIHISLRKENLLMRITLTSILIGILADVALINGGYGIIGVASGTAFSLFAYSCFTMGSITRLLGLRRAAFMATVFLPYLITLVLLAGIHYVLPEKNFHVDMNLLCTMMRCLIFALPMSGLLFAMYIFRHKFQQRLMAD